MLAQMNEDPAMSDLPSPDALAESAAIVSETMRVLQKSDSNLVAEILRTTETYSEWDHLPADDMIDADSRSQYFYHTHARSDDGTGSHDDEHGHFHIFRRVDGEDGEELVHLIGIAMDAYGVPFRLFTVNRWVTGDLWLPADEVIALLDGFEIDDTRPSWALNLWLTHMVRLFRTDIIRLIRERDAAVADWRAAHPDRDVLEDRELEVTSQMDFSLADAVSELMAGA